MFRLRSLSTLAAAIGLVFASWLAEAAPVALNYSTGVTEKQRELLNKDLERLSRQNFGDSSGELRRVLKLKDASSVELETWLSARARYVIDEKHPFNALTIFALSPMEYPVAGDAPVATPENEQPTPAPTEPQNARVDGVLKNASFDQASNAAEGGGGTPSTPDEKPAEEESGPTIVMGNMGAAMYMIGRQNNVVVGFNMAGQGIIPIVSPRVGLFQVGRGLFQPLSPKWAAEVIEDFVHSMFRMDTLFHEARHSDGSARVSSKQLGFAHEICPPGHELAGFPACDRPSNGPYRVGSLILKSAIEGCGPECTVRDREILTLLYADSMSRILTPTTRAANVSQDDLCAKLLRTRTNIPFCEAPDESTEARVIEWDDAHEEVVLPQRQFAGE